MRYSVEIAVKNRIIDHGRGWCFTPMRSVALQMVPLQSKFHSLR